MWTKSLSMIAVLTIAIAANGMAEHGPDEEPVLRLRLVDEAPKPLRPMPLRPRLNSAITTKKDPVPTPRVSVQEVGDIGKLAYVSTPHPNLVLAVGSTEDRTEIGRQIDRAIADLGGNKPLFDHPRDRAPFIGVGVRAQVAKTGWSVDASVGASLINRAEQTRVFGSFDQVQAQQLEAEAQANFRLRYRF